MKIESLSVDLETRSSIDITKAGVYKYAESPDFDILLFGVSVNGGPVAVYDLASGDKVPEEIIKALSDDSVTKRAYNSSFERVTLSVWLRRNYPQHFSTYSIEEDPVQKYLDPAAWKCTLVWAAYNGLPLSLDKVGAVLGFEEQKLKEGKELIRYFCMPSRTAGRKWNQPEHAPEKWELFKKYNRRDVEVEMQIQKRLKNYPVPDFVWDEYHLDQEINDRGIMIDRQLVEQAISIDEQTKKDLMARMQKLTGLDNPNSVMQLKGYLANNGLETETLGKKDVAALLKSVPADMAEVLNLRLQLAKSSVKKYQAMQNAVCDDDRCHGMFQFYGANRSGRWCLTGDHEVLTADGWQRLDAWNGGSIACWNPSSAAVSFQQAQQVSFDYKGPMYTYHDGRIDQCSTPDHKMRVQRRYGSAWTDMTVEEMAACRPSIPMNGYRYHRGCANPAWLRVLIMTQADGHYTADGSVRYHFKKQRKIERCKHLLRKAEIPFVIGEHKDTTVITVHARSVPLWLREFRTKTFGFWLLDENPDIFFDELPNWDGYYAAPNSIQYSTCNKQNADIVQALAHMSGRCAVMRIKKHNEKNANWNDAYVVDIWLTPGDSHEIRVKPTIDDFNGKVYCAVTQTGYFLVRRGGKVWVTGNSGRLVQLQNLPQNHMSDLEQARDLVKAGDYEMLNMLYDSVPNVLSELIRTAFIPRPGYKFIVSDFSAIEARVLSHLAGEKWRTEVFSSGGDIYCASASQMFKVPVEKHGVNSHLRQKGKIAELALGYGGSVGALKAMGALDMGLSEEELQPLVNMWRNSNPHVVNFWWQVDNAVKTAIQMCTSEKVGNITFTVKSGMLFITLPSGRKLAYVKPRIGMNQFGGESVTYMGIDATKKWSRIESYGPKFVENIVQAISRDILAYAMQTLKHCFIVGHVHDELIIECSEKVSLEKICKQMGRTPEWITGLPLRADGYECMFYKKD